MRNALALLLLPVLLALPAVIRTPAARAGDAPEARDEPARIDLGAFAAPPAVAAAKHLWTPIDAGFTDSWHHGEPNEDAVLLTLQEPPYPDWAVSPEVVEDLLRRLVPESASPTWASKATMLGLDVWSTPEGVAKARAAVRFLRDGLAPRLPVSATLLARDGKGGTRLVAAGAVSLLPRRWTALWSHRSVRRFVAAYEIEIAQESTASSPAVAALPEGEELFARWSPGEATSVVEVCSLQVDHLDPYPVDLSGIRNVPESNAPGRIDLPKSAVRRVVTACAVPAAAGGPAEIAWDDASGGRTLRLVLGPAPAAPDDAEVAAGRMGVVRAGASAAALDDGMREGRIERAIERFQSGGATGARDVRALEAYAQAFLVCEAAPAAIDRLRAETRRAEGRLATAVVDLRAVAVPEPALRGDLEAGRLAVGRPLEAAQATDLLAGRGATAPVAAVRVPVLCGTKTSFRSGASVTGISSMEVEVAQQSGGLALPVGAWFDGLAGDVSVALAEDGGATLSASGVLAWARPDGSTAELAFRLPVSMSRSTAPPGVDTPEVRRFPVPLAAHGQSQVQVTAPLAAADVAEGRWVLLGVFPRGAAEGPPQTVLLLASVKR